MPMCPCAELRVAACLPDCVRPPTVSLAMQLAWIGTHLRLFRYLESSRRKDFERSALARWPMFPTTSRTFEANLQGISQLSGACKSAWVTETINFEKTFRPSRRAALARPSNQLRSRTTPILMARLLIKPCAHLPSSRNRRNPSSLRSDCSKRTCPSMRRSATSTSIKRVTCGCPP